jgi:hypothetical protein
LVKPGQHRPTQQFIFPRIVNVSGHSARAPRLEGPMRVVPRFRLGLQVCMNQRTVGVSLTDFVELSPIGHGNFMEFNHRWRPIRPCSTPLPDANDVGAPASIFFLHCPITPRNIHLVPIMGSIGDGRCRDRSMHGYIATHRIKATSGGIVMTASNRNIDSDKVLSPRTHLGDSNVQPVRKCASSEHRAGFVESARDPSDADVVRSQQPAIKPDQAKRD